MDNQNGVTKGQLSHIIDLRRRGVLVEGALVAYFDYILARNPRRPFDLADLLAVLNEAPTVVIQEVLEFLVEGGEQSYDTIRRIHAWILFLRGLAGYEPNSGTRSSTLVGGRAWGLDNDGYFSNYLDITTPDLGVEDKWKAAIPAFPGTSIDCNGTYKDALVDPRIFQEMGLFRAVSHMFNCPQLAVSAKDEIAATRQLEKDAPGPYWIGFHPYIKHEGDHDSLVVLDKAHPSRERRTTLPETACVLLQYPFLLRTGMWLLTSTPVPNFRGCVATFERHRRTGAIRMIAVRD